MSMSSEQVSIIDSAMAECAHKGWRNTHFADIAERMGCTEHTLKQHFPHKNAILNGLYDYLDESLLIVDSFEDENVRERLFAIMMERLDLASPYRDAFLKMRDEGLPKITLCRGKSWLKELSKAAGTSKDWQKIHLLGLGLIWTMVLPVWFADESRDLSKTMAVLDTQLGNAEHLWQTVQGWYQKNPIEQPL